MKRKMLIKPNLKKQQGFAIAQVLVALALMGALGGVSYLYNQNQKIGFNKNLVTTAGTVLTQVSTTLTTDISAGLISNGITATLSDIGVNTIASTNDGADGSVTPVAGITAYQDGFEIPTVSSAQKLDPWGTKILYCPWDNGNGLAASNSGYGSTKYITGDLTSTQGSIVFAVISAGPDKIFQTTCANIKAGIRNGDDGFRSKLVSDVKQGVGGTKYYGDPTTAADLATIIPNGIGEIRVDPSTGISYVYAGAIAGCTTGIASTNPAVPNGCWNPITPKGTLQTENSTCTTVGAIATDSSGNLLVCQ